MQEIITEGTKVLFNHQNGRKKATEGERERERDRERYLEVVLIQ